jgi:hypothetical protein
MSREEKDVALFEAVTREEVGSGYRVISATYVSGGERRGTSSLTCHSGGGEISVAV